jgi:hypothetical protein
MILNLKNGKLTLENHRLVDATVTTQDDIYKSFKNGSTECLTASVGEVTWWVQDLQESNYNKDYSKYTLNL